MGRPPDKEPCTWVYLCTACGKERTGVIQPQGQFVDEATYVGPCCRRFKVGGPHLVTSDGHAVAPPPYELLRARGYLRP